MQPPRRPPARPPSGQGRPPQEDIWDRLPQQQETQQVVRKPHPQGPQETWLMQRRRIRPRHFLAIFAVFFVFVCAMMVNSARVRTLTNELEDKKAEVKAALVEVAERERLLSFSTTDEYIEQQARLRFGYINADEIRFMPDASLVNDFGTY